jgi:hypothetical protein
MGYTVRMEPGWLSCYCDQAKGWCLGNLVRLLIGERHVALFQSVQIDSEAYKASYAMGTGRGGGYFKCLDLERVKMNHYSPICLHGVHMDKFTFTLKILNGLFIQK